MEGQFFQLWVRAEPAFAFQLHFHPEYELTLITRGRGTRVVGDHVGDYAEGDLILLGPELPHTWSSVRAAGRRRGGGGNEAFVLQFKPALFGPDLLKQPDLARLANLLKKARRGLRFQGATRSQAAQLLRACHAATGLRRFVKLFELFELLADSRETQVLASKAPGYAGMLGKDGRMEQLYEYLHAHCVEPVGLESVARHFNLSPSTLHRQLRKATGRSLTELVNELRISQACNLLAHTELRIAEVCYQCGYQNLSYFNRRFLALKQLTPREYRRKFLNPDTSGVKP